MSLAATSFQVEVSRCTGVDDSAEMMNMAVWRLFNERQIYRDNENGIKIHVRS